MYTRNYFGSADGSSALPANYDGTAFTETKTEEKRDTGTTVSEKEPESAPASANVGGGFEGIFNLLKKPFGALFSSGGGIGFPKLGTEEILIIAVAAFLFFSKDGDRECALLLLLLLIVN